jgi:N-acetylglutamate synthase-like GNAT family acetyltransferase
MEAPVENTVRIRGIALEDIGAIQEIRKSISEEDNEAEFLRFIEQQVGVDQYHSNLVAQINDQVVGYMISTVLYAGFGLKKSAWIMSIGVHPDYMGRGIGLKLAEGVCEIYRTKGIENIYSSVLWDSTDVLSFFKKLGFERSEFINLKKKL